MRLFSKTQEAGLLKDTSAVCCLATTTDNRFIIVGCYDGKIKI